jgi:predicted Zn-dependent protease with MMP-like domain
VLTDSEAFRETPYFSTELTDMPSELAVREATPDEVANGKLLGSYRRGKDGQLVVVFYSRPLLLWADDPEEMHRLVRQTLIEQLAHAAGIDPDDLDQEDRES